MAPNSVFVDAYVVLLKAIILWSLWEKLKQITALFAFISLASLKVGLATLLDMAPMKAVKE